MDTELYRKWIEDYDRPTGPWQAISPQGWRDALREALDEVERLQSENRQFLLTKTEAFESQKKYAAENERLKEKLSEWYPEETGGEG